MRKVRFLSLVVAVLLGATSHAAIRLVPAEYPSIQQAISDCNDGDTVIVSPGVYYETINFSGKDIVLTSRDPNDPKIVGYTIINADEDGTVVTFENGESSKAVLTGFTITGGVGTLAEWSSEYDKYFYGAGIYCAWGSPTITRNVIRNNHGPYVDEQRGNQWYYETTLWWRHCLRGLESHDHAQCDLQQLGILRRGYLRRPGHCCQQHHLSQLGRLMAAACISARATW